MSNVWRAGGRKPKPKKPISKEAVVEAVGFSHDGKGVVHVENSTVFVDGLFAGEQGRIKLSATSKKRFDTELLEIITRSPSRIQAACEHHQDCGGCVWQSLSYEAQVQAKEQRLERLIETLGVQVERDASYMSEPYHYRRRVRFSVIFNGERASLGYRQRNSKKVKAVSNCNVLIPEIESQIEALESWLSLAKGGINELLVTYDKKLLLGLGKQTTISSATFNRLAEAAREQGFELTSYDDSERAHSLTAYDFLQANEGANAAMKATLVNWLDTKAERVVDLFSGLGNFSKVIADELGAEVVGYEIDKGMVARANALALDKVIFKVSDLFSGGLPKAIFDADALVLDPPRAGAHHIVQQLVANADKLSALKQIAYISCDPATQVRDAKYLLEAGYRLRTVKMVDMFPHTPHIESMMLFAKEL